MRYLITGATGFVGGHLAAACRQRGFPVTTIARATSDTSRLESLGVQIVRGDLSDRTAVEKALGEAQVVVHCAAKVGDWGDVSDYRTINVDALRGLLEACRARTIHRFVHLSSLGVYEARHHYGTQESEPLPAQHVDGYTQTKVEAEQLVQQYQREHRLPTVILRPGFIYGPRDRTLMPKIIARMRRRQLRYVGWGSRKLALNTIYIANLLDAIFLAVEKPEAVGQIYNLTDGERVTKQQFVQTVISGLGLPRLRPLVPPLWLARLVAATSERLARRAGAKEAPTLTQAGLKFMALNLDFSIDKARRELGYQPRVSFAEGMEQTMAWYRQNP